MSDTTFTVDKENLEVRVERLYNATAARIFEACTSREQIPQWWGPAKYKTVVDKLDLRVGGEWRFVQTDEEGTEHAFHGAYQEIDAPNKVVNTFEYEPMPGHVLVETLTLEEQPDGTTKLRTVSKYQNIEDLEGMVSMGMESGAREGQARLGALVE